MNSADPRLPRLGLVRERAEDARHLVDALVELGAAPVLELAGADLGSQAIADADIEVLVVGLGTDIDAAVFGSLDRVRVVFDDLQASAGLSGWDRSRWLRHLRAKLLGITEGGPPRPAGASPIQPRTAGPVVDDVATPAAHPGAGADGSGEDLVTREDLTPILEAAVDHAAAGAPGDTGEALDLDRTATPFAEGPADVADSGSIEDLPDAMPEDPTEQPRVEDDVALGLSWAIETTEYVDDPAILASPESMPSMSWDAPQRDLAETRVGEDAVGGLDELLDALRRDEAAPEARGPAGSFAVTPEPSERTPEAEAPRRFDLSALSLEPLEDERPVTGRARFIVDEAPRVPMPPVPTPPAPPAAASGAGPATAAWLLAAGEAGHARVTEFLEALPADIDAMILLVRPATAPWLGATLAVEGGRGLPMVLGDEVMEPTGGRVVVLSPGERAGFNRSGQLTVQPGDHAMPEALGDWMTMRAIAGRYGRDAGVIVFGRLRDEVLEGAIELARAGGQVWFEASVLDEPNPVVDAARAAGIAMRTGSATELAEALTARLRC